MYMFPIYMCNYSDCVSGFIELWALPKQTKLLLSDVYRHSVGNIIAKQTTMSFLFLSGDWVFFSWNETVSAKFNQQYLAS